MTVKIIVLVVMNQMLNDNYDCIKTYAEILFFMMYNVHYHITEKHNHCSDHELHIYLQ